MHQTVSKNEPSPFLSLKLNGDGSRFHVRLLRVDGLQVRIARCAHQMPIVEDSLS